MSKRKYSEVEMIGALKQMEAGRSAAERGGGGAGVRSVEAHHLCVEGKVWGNDGGGGTAAAAAGG
jgi:hypothetical protein